MSAATNTNRKAAQVGIRQHLDLLRRAVRLLPPSGEDGFEGLLAVALGALTGLPFRISSSGSQFGRDGASIGVDLIVAFEAKRYDRKIPADNIKAKLFDLSISAGDIDLWILGATVGVGDQIATDLEKFSSDTGVAVLTLDWPKAGIGLLPICLALAQSPVAEFFQHNLGDSSAKARGALANIARSAQYKKSVGHLLRKLDEALQGCHGARKACESGLLKALSDRDSARSFFGQPLCPGDPQHPAIHRNETLRAMDWIKLPPDGSIGVVLGAEGTGKSWLFAQAWRATSDRPLTLWLRADQATARDKSPEDLIIEHICRTAGYRGERPRRALQRQFERWRGAPTPNRPRILVVFDGVNQRPEVNWQRQVEDTNKLLGELGGRLVLTSRTQYFRDRLKQRLISKVDSKEVGDWTTQERDMVLEAHGYSALGSASAASDCLCNPRLLGIAIRLMQEGSISDLTDLNESRLLFEHMRHQEQTIADSPSAVEFAMRLRGHAQQVLERLKQSKRDDLAVFPGQLEAVADGRFFASVPGDSSRYQLKASGLTMALAFALLDDLRSAERNEQSVHQRLEHFVDPIATLDRTTDVLLAALTIACMDEEYSNAVGAAVITQFSAAQNPAAEAELPPFLALAKQVPAPFLESARELLLAGIRFEQFDWLDRALRAAAGEDRGLPQVSEHICSWLRHIPSTVEGRPGHFIHWDEELDPQREKLLVRLRQRLTELTSAERAIQSRLIESDSGHINRLVEYAFRLMHGCPLAGFAAALADCSFAEVLNGPFDSTEEEFDSLIRANRKDWRETRDQLFSQSEKLAEGSPTGKWAAVALLRATGSSDDAQLAEELVEDLTRDWVKHKSWRRAERYCASDPCDPESVRPENVAATAAKYADIDVSQLRLFMGYSEADHFLVDARPAMARFAPEVGAAKHRQLIKNLLDRKGLPLRQALFEVHENASLVTRWDAVAAIARIQSETLADVSGDLSDQDRLLIGSMHLQLAIPHLSAPEQFSALKSVQGGRDVLLSVLDLCLPLASEEFRESWDECKPGSLDIYLLLAHALWSGTTVPADVLPDLLELASGEDAPIRSLAMGLVAASGDHSSINQLALRLRGYASRGDRHDRERWAGTRILCLAAQGGALTPEDAVARVAPELYGPVATELGGRAAKQIALRLDLALSRLLNVPFELPNLDVTLQGPVEISPRARPIFDIEAVPEADSQSPEALRRTLESGNELEATRRRRVVDEFHSFQESLAENDCGLMLDHIGFSAMEEIATEDADLVLRWARRILSADAQMQRRVASFGVALANAISQREPDLAADLLLVTGDAFVRTVYGAEKIELQTLAVWRQPDHPKFDSLRTTRLDGAANDDELAMEVLAACKCGKQTLLDGYVTKRMASEHPLDKARAVTVAGYSCSGPVAAEALTALEGSHGIVGAAWKAAKDAYIRNAWAKHWYNAFLAANSDTEIWRNGVLLLKVVDPRFELWREQSVAADARIERAGLDDRISNRYQRLRDKRKKTLFGSKVPNPSFMKGLTHR